jgi:undecaprenyl-diphosphatase
MPLYQAVVLAIVQGLTEFLPVSSTAHLTLFPWFLHWNDPGLTFDVALHAGTLLAVLLYFWRTWVEMIMAVLGIGPRTEQKSENSRLFWYLVIGTIPAAVAGALFEKAADRELRQPMLIAAALIVVALLMWRADHLEHREQQLGQVTFTDAVLVGLSQALAIIPGVSRSGITMTTGLFRGLDRETAARFSFLLSTPIIAGACLKKALEIRHEGIPPEMHLPFIVGVLVSAVVGYVVIAGLLRFLTRHTFKAFVIYRIALGLVVIALWWELLK